MEFLASPYNLWVSDDLKLKRLLLRMALADKISHTKHEGYGTPITTAPYKVLASFFVEREKRMVRLERERWNSVFEQLTEWESYLRAENIDIDTILNEHQAAGRSKP